MMLKKEFIAQQEDFYLLPEKCIALEGGNGAQGVCGSLTGVYNMEKGL